MLKDKESKNKIVFSMFATVIALIPTWIWLVIVSGGGIWLFGVVQLVFAFIGFIVIVARVASNLTSRD